MGRCASHGYYATDLCDICYPLRECESCAALRAELERESHMNTMNADALVQLRARIEDTEGMGKAIFEEERLEDMPDWGTDNYFDADYMRLALAVQKFLKGEG